MLRGGNPLTVGVGTIIEVIRKNNSDYDMDNGAPDAIPSSNDPIYLGSLLRNFAKHVPDFMELILSPTHTVPDGDSTMTIQREDLSVAFGSKIEPLGFDRFKTCELMAELLHCSNMGLLNEPGSEAYVHQRDQERDRLKAEGALTSSRHPASAVTDFSEDGAAMDGSSPLATSFGSPQQGRKLEVANNADDDGFEDVGTSADLDDDIKEDFDEKEAFELETKPAQIQNLIKQAKPRLDLDEEFVDEPLTSPKLEAVDQKGEREPEPSGTIKAKEPEAVSPTTALSSEVTGLSIDNDTPMVNDDSYEFTEFQGPEPTAPAPLNIYSEPEAPPLPHRDRPVELKSPDTITPPDILIHPEDKPAPLFAKRPDHETSGEMTEQPKDHVHPAHGSHEIVDSAQGQESEGDRSVLMTNNDQSFEPHIEHDDDGEPLVGDLLKIMFVEHKVVPTILVRMPSYLVYALF